MKSSPLPSPSLSSRSQRPASSHSTHATPPSPRPVDDSNRPPKARPPLQRHGNSRSPLKDTVEKPSAKQMQPAVSTDDSATESDTSSRAEPEDDRGGNGKPKARSPSEIQLENLKREMNDKLQMEAQRLKFGARRIQPGSIPVDKRKPSPIKEEGGDMSPSLHDAFSSPLPTGSQTTSTESTESTKTIRGSAAATPYAAPLRTPSYPFPYVPGTPGARYWNSSFQPFTTLSPTISAMNSRDTSTPRESMMSGSTTPADSTGTFRPPGEQSIAGDPDYPSPNLYETVLALNAEPGLEAWWASVVGIMHDWYRAERITLAVPADASDLENVPWGQKASFNIYGPSNVRSGARAYDIAQAKLRTNMPTAAERSPSGSLSGSNSSDPSKNIKTRPRVQTRHSFAGHERERKELSSDTNNSLKTSSRPRGPQRTASHAPSSTHHNESSLRNEYQKSTAGSVSQATQQRLRNASFSDLEFSSVGGDASGEPYFAVFPTLRALNHETDALIDTAGINRILERGKLVTITRDYSTDQDAQRKDSDRSDISQTTEIPLASTSKVPARSSKGSSKEGLGSSPHTRFSEDMYRPNLSTHYEEYEQYPTSPWAQSPAPSPAIQNDPAENPFFTPSRVDEETFSPSGSNEDYSRFGPVEAIGIDRASTVTHLPLIHPTLSLPMSTSSPESPYATGDDAQDEISRSRRPSAVSMATEAPRFVKRQPIAILSILSSTVPYPHNLTHTLKLLGPHLATSFSNALQFSVALGQVHSTRHRRYSSGRHDFAPLATGAENLEDAMQLRLDLEGDFAGSMAGSMTSPSDYSGRSKHSPSGSLVGTPGWDPSSIGFSSKVSVSVTPGIAVGSEAVDSYFDTKRRATTSRPASRASIHEQSVPNQVPSSLAIEHGHQSRKAVSVATTATDDTVAPRVLYAGDRGYGQGEPVAQIHPDQPTPTSPRRPTLRWSNSQLDRGDRQHSLLHSYGADFSSSFQSLPVAAATSAMPTPGLSSGAIKGSGILDTGEMAPPSERLLRTIIDALPVQIFLTSPSDGHLTWVNSKFLVYGGQDPRHALDEPWQAIHFDDREQYMHAWNLSLRTGQQLQHKVRLQRFDGVYRWFYVRAVPLKDKRQTIRHWIGTNMNIHEQHLAELNSARQQETAASEAKYRALANSSPQIVFAAQKSKGVIFCNSQWLSYSGQTEEEAYRTGFMDYVHPADLVKCQLPSFDDESSTATNVPTTMPPEPRRAKSSSSSEESSDTGKTVTSPGGGSPTTMELPQARLSKLAGSGILKVSRDADGRVSYSTEVRLRSKDGVYRWHLVRVLLAEPVLQDERMEGTWYGTCTDINDHKLLEQTLKETMDAKSRFLSNMSHEIRTPLNGITGMVNFLIDSNLTSEQMEHVNIIRSSTEGLRDLINDILDLSKVEAGMINLNLGWLHLRSVIEEVNDLTSAMAIGKGLELNYIIEEAVPSYVKGDKFRIRQVLLNVIGNAIKFTQKGEVFVRCRIYPEALSSLSSNEIMILFEVIDTGSGFTEQEALVLFKRFSQIDGSSTRQHGGTGLGLAISMQLVELHGGRMTAKGVPGKGSTFNFSVKFTLPSEEDHPTPELATPGVGVIETSTAPSPLKSVAEESVAFSPKRPFIQSPKSNDSRKSQFSDISSSSKQMSPAASSEGSAPSIRTKSTTSLKSERSSASSFTPDPSLPEESSIRLNLPSDTSRTVSTESAATIRPTSANPERSQALSPLGTSLSPPLFSIFVVCPLHYATEATVRHLEMTLPKTVPHKITPCEDISRCMEMLGREDPIIFSHIVLVLHEASDVITLLDLIIDSQAHSSTSIVMVSDLAQKREVMLSSRSKDYSKLTADKRLHVIFKPLKPSKLAPVFDPQKSREMSVDPNESTAENVALNQKQLFARMKSKFGGNGIRVLLVEDNFVNQKVSEGFLRKMGVKCKTVADGVQCTDNVFAKDHGYYSLILCDLHMPNKDGYQTCREIRRWEKEQHYPNIPIIATSANVLGDVYDKCVQAGFHDYVTKPLKFPELAKVMETFLDPEDPSKPRQLLHRRRRG